MADIDPRGRCAMSGGIVHPSASGDRRSWDILDGRSGVDEVSASRGASAAAAHGAPRKLPELWTHRPRPQLLGNHRAGFPQLPQGLLLLMRTKTKGPSESVNLSTKPGQAQHRCRHRTARVEPRRTGSCARLPRVPRSKTWRCRHLTHSVAKDLVTRRRGTGWQRRSLGARDSGRVSLAVERHGFWRSGLGVSTEDICHKFQVADPRAVEDRRE